MSLCNYLPSVLFKFGSGGQPVRMYANIYWVSSYEARVAWGTQGQGSEVIKRYLESSDIVLPLES